MKEKIREQAESILGVIGEVVNSDVSTEEKIQTVSRLADAARVLKPQPKPMDTELQAEESAETEDPEPEPTGPGRDEIENRVIKAASDFGSENEEAVVEVFFDQISEARAEELFSEGFDEEARGLVHGIVDAIQEEQEEEETGDDSVDVDSTKEDSEADVNADEAEEELDELWAQIEGQ